MKGIEAVKKNRMSRRTAVRLVLLLLLILYAIVLYLLCTGISQSFRPPATFTAEATGRRIAAPPLTGEIDINAASAEELQALPGIGPKYSEAIVEYRESHGGFDFAEDLMNVRGIGDKRFDAVQPLISIGEYRTPPPSDVQ